VIARHNRRNPFTISRIANCHLFGIGILSIHPPSELPVVDRVRVLIADDNPAMLDAVKRMLQSEFQVVAALEQPNAVLISVTDLKPDVVVLDVSMGEMNGFEVARLLRGDSCMSKIIFLTVHEELDFIRAAFDAGASGYVFKSRMNTDLRVAINTVHRGKIFIPGAPILDGEAR
jgi:DNA-binding NarL/FixJ family response regulator